MRLYECTNYTADIDYIISQYIREYDIQKANINILLKYNVISYNEYEYLKSLDRIDRQIKIGLMIKDNHKINDILEEGFKESRRLFIESNNIKDNEILSIKKDAIYVINKIPNITQFNNINFVNKNTYTSFYKLVKHIDAYYFLDTINGIENLDIKGISDDILPIHNNYFLEFLKVIFESAQIASPKDTIDIITEFYNNYILLNLDNEYYREFNAGSRFRFKTMSMVDNFTSNYILNNNAKSYLDISFNIEIIRNLFKYFSMQLIKQIR